MPAGPIATPSCADDGAAPQDHRPDARPVWRLLAALGHPERDLPPVIHIAGHQRQGLDLAMIRAGLEAEGKRVHAYTSPHLALPRTHPAGGQLISEPDLTAVLDECEAANGGEPITYFEITTCAAFLAFARTPADYTLLEVGLGGRLDATNVVDRPALTSSRRSRSTTSSIWARRWPRSRARRRASSSAACPASSARRRTRRWR
jgi:folylpolyglutamate synthase/dihydropteroate synthase